MLNKLVTSPFKRLIFDEKIGNFDVNSQRVYTPNVWNIKATTCKRKVFHFKRTNKQTSKWPQSSPIFNVSCLNSGHSLTCIYLFAPINKPFSLFSGFCAISFMGASHVLNMWLNFEFLCCEFLCWNVTTSIKFRWIIPSN